MSSINDSGKGSTGTPKKTPDAAFSNQAQFNFEPDKSELAQAQQNAQQNPSMPRQLAMQLFCEPADTLPERCELLKMLCEIIAQPEFEGWKAQQSNLSPGNELQTKTVTLKIPTGETLVFEPIQKILCISGTDKEGHEIQFIKPNLDDPQIKVDFPERLSSTDGTHLHLGMTKGCVEKETLEVLIKEIVRHNIGGREIE